jgi:hypothetical protein
VPAIPHVVRRGAVYYWRRRMPARLAESKRSATLLLGLRTSDPRRARVLAAEWRLRRSCNPRTPVRRNTSCQQAEPYKRTPTKRDSVVVRAVLRDQADCWAYRSASYVAAAARCHPCSRTIADH